MHPGLAPNMSWDKLAPVRKPAFLFAVLVISIVVNRREEPTGGSHRRVLGRGGVER